MQGKVPSRDDIAGLSEELNLKENQVYKWFWDTKKRVEEDALLARQMGRSPSIVGNEEHTRALRREKDCLGVDGRDGTGRRLTPQQIKMALKIN